MNDATTRSDHADPISIRNHDFAVHSAACRIVSNLLTDDSPGLRIAVLSADNVHETQSAISSLCGISIATVDHRTGRHRVVSRTALGIPSAQMFVDRIDHADLRPDRQTVANMVEDVVSPGRLVLGILADTARNDLGQNLSAMVRMIADAARVVPDARPRLAVSTVRSGTEVAEALADAAGLDRRSVSVVRIDPEQDA